MGSSIDPSWPLDPRVESAAVEAVEAARASSSSSIPAIAVRIWTRSTTPMSRPSSTTLSGRSVAAAWWMTVRMTVSGGNSGPVRGSSKRGSRMTQRRVRTCDLGTSRTKSAT